MHGPRAQSDSRLSAKLPDFDDSGALCRGLLGGALLLRRDLLPRAVYVATQEIAKTRAIARTQQLHDDFMFVDAMAVCHVSDVTLP